MKTLQEPWPVTIQFLLPATSSQLLDTWWHLDLRHLPGLRFGDGFVDPSKHHLPATRSPSSATWPPTSTATKTQLKTAWCMNLETVCSFVPSFLVGATLSRNHGKWSVQQLLERTHPRPPCSQPTTPPWHLGVSPGWLCVHGCPPGCNVARWPRQTEETTKNGPPRLEWSLGWTEPDESQNPKRSQKHVNHIWWFMSFHATLFASWTEASSLMAWPGPASISESQTSFKKSFKIWLIY